MIRIQCPNCEKLLRVDDSRAGMVGACPACKKKFRIPGDRADAPAESPAKRPPRSPDEEERPRKPTAAMPRKAAKDEDEDGYGFEEVSAPPPRKRPSVEDKTPAPPSNRRRPESDADDRRDDEDDRRPADDQEERPRKRRKKKRRRQSEGFLANLDTYAKCLLGIGVFWLLFSGLALAVPFLGFVLIAVGVIIGGIGGIWMLLEAFGESVMWGLAYLFLPFAPLVFLIMFWDRCARPFLLQLAGSLVLFTGFGIVAMRFVPDLP